MKSKKPFLSILIPTKNRANYLKDCISSLLLIPDSNLEIVIQDNSDSFNPPDFNDERLKYYHTTGPLSISDNFSLAFKNSIGNYITFIGDDDTVNPRIMEFVTFANLNNLDSVVGDVSAKLIWSDVSYSLYGSVFNNKLFIKSYSKKCIYPCPKNEILKCGKSAARGFNLLPKAYQGICHRRILDKVQEDTRELFLGPTPDMSLALTIAAYTLEGRYCYFDYPIFLPGTAKGSGGGLGVKHEHIWNLTSCKWVDNRHIQNWSNYSPRFATGITLWAECFLQTGTILNKSYLEYFNINRYFARLLVFNSNLFKYNVFFIKGSWKKLKPSGIKIFVYSIIELLDRLYYLLKNFLKILQIKSRCRNVYPVESISHAARVISEIPLPKLK